MSTPAVIQSSASTAARPVASSRDEEHAVIVTGASGFLGSLVCAEFKLSGYRVVGVGREPDVRGTCDQYLQAELPSRAFEHLVTSVQPSLIVHAAGPASVPASFLDPVQDFVGTTVVLASLLDAVRRNSPRSRVVVFSSAAVYGNPPSLPVTEEAPLEPVSPYGFHKLAAEGLLREYADVYGVRSAGLRIFSAYGPGLRKQLAWDVCEKIRNNGVVRLFGTGEETRDFVHGRDVARACMAIAKSAPMLGETFNVASGQETTVRKVAELIVEALRPGTTIEFTRETRLGDPLRWRADISAIGALGFAPSVPIEAGMTEYADWYASEENS